MGGTAITAFRTAAASAVATDVLAIPGASVLAVIGSGPQAAAHLDYVPRVRGFTDIRVFARRPSAAAELVAGRSAARAVGSLSEAVAGADVVCCCTGASAPVLGAADLGQGTHVNSVGTGAELAPDLVAEAVFAEWKGAATEAVPAGARELQALGADRVTEIGAVLSGTAPGRTSAAQLTVYKSTGHAVEDVAAAALAYRRARERGIGKVFCF
jgi:ornithine cyclodeaminase/alanine dehydrogenase-like protein (mu-crystallin family)